MLTVTGTLKIVMMHFWSEMRVPWKDCWILPVSKLVTFVSVLMKWYVPLISGIVKSAIFVAIGKSGIAPGAIVVSMAILSRAMFVLRTCTEAG